MFVVAGKDCAKGIGSSVGLLRVGIGDIVAVLFPLCGTRHPLAPSFQIQTGVVTLEEELRAQRAGGAAAVAAGAAPAALHSLLASLQRARHLLSLGARELLGEAQMAKAVQVGPLGG